MPRPPDIAGRRAKVWLVTPTPACAAKSQACLETWLVHYPGIHPFWSWWAVSVCSLADMPGLPPAQIRLDGASHEVIIVALNPEAGEPNVDDQFDALPWMSPPELCHQVKRLTDDQARRLVGQLCRAFADGVSAPDGDYRSRNEALLTGTAAHLAAGLHEVS